MTKQEFEQIIIEHKRQIEELIQSPSKYEKLTRPLKRRSKLKWLRRIVNTKKSLR